MNEKKYEEIGKMYRFFLGWRHASLAGYIAVLYGIISLTATIYEKDQSVAWIVPLIGAPIGIVFLIIDIRTRDLYHEVMNAGKSLEGETGGFFTRLKDNVSIGKGETRWISHSRALEILFVGYSLVMIICSICLCINANQQP